MKSVNDADQKRIEDLKPTLGIDEQQPTSR